MNNKTNIFNQNYFYLFSIYFLILVYTISFSLLSISRFESFNSGIYDMGIMDQTVWNTSHGRLLIESVNLGYPISRIWSAHWEIIFLPLSLFYHVWASPKFLLILQSLVVALGAMPLYRLTKEKLGNHLAVIIIPLAYLLYPALQNANLFDVHGVTFATSFLIFTFYFLKQGKKLFLWVFFALSLLCREDSSLILFMFGLYAIFLLKNRRTGVLMVLISVSWFLLYFNKGQVRELLGLSEVVRTIEIPGRWDHLGGGGLFGVVIYILTNPKVIFNLLFTAENLEYLIKLFAPLAFICLLAPDIMILAAPIFLINLLSSSPFTHGIEHHYNATIIPILFIATIYGIKRLSDFCSRIKMKISFLERLRFVNSTFFSLIVLLLCLLAFIFKSKAWAARNWVRTSHHDVIENIIKSIPQQASLATTNMLGAHAAHREELYILPMNVETADYILYDFYRSFDYLKAMETYEMPKVKPINRYSLALLADTSLGIIQYEEGVALFKRGADYLAGIRQLALEEDLQAIQNQSKILLPGGIELLGYTKRNKVGVWRGTVHLTVYWRASKSLFHDLKFTLKIENKDFEKIIEHTPVFSVFPTHYWNEGEIVRDEIYIEIPKSKHGNQFSMYGAVNTIGNHKSADDFIHLFDFYVE
ncbi:MAG: DUF2079 domain-containing protein [bacterium]